MNYSKKVMDYFLNPKNMGELKNPDGVGRVGNPTCGDIMEVHIHVGKNAEGEEIIKDIKFKTFGCGAAIATSSILTELAKNKTLKESQKLSMKNISEELGGLPKIKTHCAGLAAQALKKAIEDYESKKQTLNNSNTLKKQVKWIQDG